MKTLYFDCFSGISGDMTIGALLDLGVELDFLKTEISKLPLIEGVDVDLRRSDVVRANIGAIKFDVVTDDGAHSPSATPGHVHRHEDGSVHRGPHSHSHGTLDPGRPDLDPGGKSHAHRKASDIIAMIQQSALPVRTRQLAVGIFEKLAASEGRVHRMPPEDVEFHEVGALDSIVDVVGAAAGFDALGVDRFLCSSVNVGAGFLECQHGVYPVPAPATVNLLSGVPLYSRHVDAELVTPTGAAILAATVDRFGPLEGFEIQKVGYGAGSRDFDSFPNCLRLFLGAEVASIPSMNSAGAADEIVVLEANVDDMSAEALSYAGERLIDSGALDVVIMPALMKKGRPGHRIEILAKPADETALSRVIFEETTTIGIRRRSTSRRVLDRDMVEVDTPYGSVRVKVARFEGRVVNVSPEYDDCARLARATRRPFREIYEDALTGYQDIVKRQAAEATRDDG